MPDRLSVFLLVWLASTALQMFAATSPAVAQQAPPVARPRTPATEATPPPGPDPLGLETVMEIALDAQPSAPAAFDAVSAYIPLEGGRLVAVDLTSGTVRWTADIATKWAPGVSAGVVVVAGDELLSGLDPASGRPLWQIPVPGGFSAPPLADTGWVIAAPASGDVLAVRGSDGGVLWTRKLEAPVRAQPVAAAHGVYLSLENGQVAALELETGAPRWTTQLGGVPGNLLVLDERLFVGSDDKWFYSLSTKDGNRNWRQRIGGRPAGAPAVDTRRVYYVALDNILHAFDRGGGSRKWFRPLPFRPSGGPMVVGDLVLVPAVAAEVYAYRPDSGEPSGRAAIDADLAAPPQIVPATSPALTRIALVTRTGVFMLLARRIEPPPTPMPYPLGIEVPLSVTAAVP